MFTNQGRLSIDQKIFFTANLSLILRSGISLVRAIEILSKQRYLRSARSELELIIISIQRGNTLADTFLKFPHIFDRMLVNLIKISESTGTLDKGFDIAKRRYERALKLKKEILSASLYPALIFMLIGGIVLFVIFYILPKLLSVFSQFPVTLPLQTRILIGFGKFISSPAIVYVALGLLALGALAVMLYAINPRARLFFSRLLFKIPFVGSFLKNSTLSLFYDNLATLIQAGIDLTNSMAIIQDTFATNLLLRDLLKDINNKILGGKSLAESLNECRSLFFDDLSIEIIKIGEETGNLDNSFLYLAKYYYGEMNTFVNKISTFLEPALLMIVGFFVAFLALSVLAPILNFVQTLNIQ